MEEVFDGIVEDFGIDPVAFCSLPAKTAEASPERSAMERRGTGIPSQRLPVRSMMNLLRACPLSSCLVLPER